MSVFTVILCSLCVTTTSAHRRHTKNGFKLFHGDLGGKIYDKAEPNLHESGAPVPSHQGKALDHDLNTHRAVTATAESGKESKIGLLNTTRSTQETRPNLMPNGNEGNRTDLPPVAPGFAVSPQQAAVNWTMSGELRAKERREAFERHLRDNMFSDEDLAQLDGGRRGEGPLAWLTALGGGTGASIGGTGSAIVDRDLLRRMHYQDKAVMLLVLMVYLVALMFSASLTYRQATNTFPVTYYADPRFHNMVIDGDDLDIFLGIFNQAPKNIMLKVAGFIPVAEDLDVNSIRWQGENYQVAFTFSLDLSAWVVREVQTTLDGPTRDGVTRTLNDGVLPEDRSTLQYYLTSDVNDLAYVELEKKVSWPDWEELATNIKLQIRQSGFTGVISVDRIETDELQVYKNKPWANFMHARATRVLCALSIIGWIAYVPYMWLRCSKTSVRSFFKVDMNILDYWPLIADKLTADGFQHVTPPGSGRRQPQTRASNVSNPNVTPPSSSRDHQRPQQTQ